MILRRKSFLRKYFFHTCSAIFALFSNVILRTPNFIHSLLVEFTGVELSFSIWNCERMSFSESCFVLGNVQLSLSCLQRWFVDSLKHLHQMFERSRKFIRYSLLWSCLRNDLFKIFFCFWNYLKVYLYSSMVFGLKQSFYQKINTVKRIQCIVFDVILRMRDNDIVLLGTIFPENTFDFAAAWQMLFGFQIRFLRMPKLPHRLFNRNVRSDYNFFDVSLQ